MVKRLTTLADVMAEAGVDAASPGCEVCQPAVASILSSLHNKHVMDRSLHGLQDTNDRFLANMQRNGTFSVVVRVATPSPPPSLSPLHAHLLPILTSETVPGQPRVAAGEITPDKMIVMGEVAKKYSLYTKITGGQRIDMFGAGSRTCPTSGGALVDAGMESGHAYAKALRTVKSCVGTTWCELPAGRVGPGALSLR